jgi:superoxide dismutase
MRANYVNEIWKIVDWYAVQDLYVTAKRAYEAARSEYKD